MDPIKKRRTTVVKKPLIALAVLAFIVAALLAIGRKGISTEILINAPIDRVWAELTDFSSYPDWNPFIKKLIGSFEQGKTIEVRIQPEGGDPFVFRPRVLLHERNRMLQWEGRLLLPGIFTGRHSFELVTVGPGKTKLVQKEDFNGILVPFINLDSTLKGFNAMNRELKKRIEGRP